jgi:hypothetical protein
MAKVRRQGPRVVACIRVSITAGMAQHMCVALQAKACGTHLQQFDNLLTH